MENISRGPSFGDFVTILTMQRGVDAGHHGFKTTEYKSTDSPPPSMKCNVLLESLSEDSQNIPCATLKSRGSRVLSIYLCMKIRLGVFVDPYLFVNCLYMQEGDTDSSHRLWAAN
jgi:hypothetical protein